MFKKFQLLFVVIVLAVDNVGTISITENKLNDFGTLLSNENNYNWTWPKLNNLIKNTVDRTIYTNFPYIMRLLLEMKLSGNCQEALKMAVMSLRQSEAWIVKMIDATAKIPSGILDGTVIDFGSFDQCLSIKVLPNKSYKSRSFQGKYCMVGFRHPLISMPQENLSNGSYADLFGEPPPWISVQMEQGRGFMKEIGFWFGVCVPSLCTNRDVQNIGHFASSRLGFNVSIADCQINEPHILNSSEIGAVSSLGCLLACVIIGTMVDVLSRLINWHHNKTWIDVKASLYSKEHWALKVLKTFSLISNTEQLLNGSNAAGSMLSFLQGIRFLSATWIILGHTYFYTDTWMYLKYRSLLGETDRFNYNLPVAVIENFTIPVGSFFFISGFLMTYTNWVKLLKSGGKINLFIFFFHKYWRMTPALGLTIALFLAMPLIGSGPLWYTTLNPETKKCLDNWWKNLLYISNMWDTNNLCLIHTWYLSALMQFHVIGILLMILVFKWPLFSVIFGFLVLSACCIFTALQVIWNDFPMPAPGVVRDFEVIQKYNSNIYIKPYAHIASYLIGMLSGFFVIKFRHRKLSYLQKSVGWVIAICFALSSVYGIYSTNTHIALRAAYISLHRISWALAISWLTFSCASKSAGLIYNILSWSAFQPLGQLSYLAYLLHPLVILFRNGSLHERVYYSHTELVLIFLSNIVVSFFLAFLCYIAVELPFSAIEAILLIRGQAKTKKSSISAISNGYPQIPPANFKSSNVQNVSVRCHQRPESPNFSSPSA